MQKTIIFILCLTFYTTIIKVQTWNTYDNTYNYGLTPKQTTKPNSLGGYDVYNNTYNYGLTPTQTVKPNSSGGYNVYDNTYNYGLTPKQTIKPGGK